MFTGLIESVGRVVAVEQMPGGVRLRVASPLAASLRVGDSIAHNGVCLTVVDRTDEDFATELGPETMRVTNLGDLAPGSPLNLERPLQPDARLGGHFVQGHVDATGVVTAVEDQGEFWRFAFTYPDSLAPLFILKGSIAVDGISLTVAALRPGEFDVQIIPFTWEHTNLHARRVGERVNLECDMLGKYVVRFAELAGWAALRPSAQG
jgi:riboflavin synthase